MRQFPVTSSTSHTDEYLVVIQAVENSVLMKMHWASLQLQNSGLDDSFKLLDLIKACQEALSRLQVST